MPVNLQGKDTGSDPSQLVDKEIRVKIDDYEQVKFIAEVSAVLEIRRYPAGRPR
jgi:hypothetical protein